MNMSKNNEMPDPEELKQMFKVLSESVPELLEKITKVLYDAQSGEKFGGSVAAFYKALKDAGMTNEQAFELSREYMSNASLGGMLKGIVGGATKDKDDLGGAIKAQIKREMAEDQKDEQ
jgi:hypothetical protein